MLSPSWPHGVTMELCPAGPHPHQPPCSFFIFIFKFYLWLCWVFVSVRGLSLVVASGGHSSSRCAGLSLSRLLTIAASLAAEHRLQTRRLSNCGSRAQSLRSMWDHPRPGLEPVCPALAGRFSTTASPGNLPCSFLPCSFPAWPALGPGGGA